MTNARRLLVALLAAAFARSAPAQDIRPVAPYSPTLTYGTGLVNIPTAWVSPTSGDLFASFSMRDMLEGSFTPSLHSSRWDYTESLEAHFAGRFSLGLSVYSLGNQSFGGFAQALVVQQPAFGSRWIPSIAIGARNIGSSKYQDRFVTGSARAVDVDGGVNNATGRGVFNGSPTFYAVATREFQFSRNAASFSVGYGNGLFANRGGMGYEYSQNGTIAKGLFMGARYVIPFRDNSAFSVLVEDDGFDVNVGGSFTFNHISVGVYGTELDESSLTKVPGALANFTKLALRFSYNASIPEIINGSKERSQAAEAQLEARRLRQEIAQRETRSAQLNAALAKAQSSAEKSAAEERARLTKQLEAEREAMKKAADRLEALQKAGAKPPTGN